jgi:uncharacterized membrane protein
MKDTFAKIDARYYVFFVLFVALVLRLFNINYEGLWNDELFTADTANPRNSLGEIVRAVKYDVHPPLHNLLSSYWSKIFSYNDTSLRVFNVLLGIWGIISIHHLARLLFNKKVALYAILLATVNYYLIRHSQEVRAYGLLFLLSNYSFYFFIKLIKGDFTFKNSISYVLITAGLLYTHYFGMFVIAGQFVASFVIMNREVIKRQFWKYLITFLAPLLLFSFWVPALKVQLERKTKTWRDTPEIEMVYTYIQEFFNDHIIAFVASTLILFSGIYLVLRNFSKSKRIEKVIGDHSKILAVLVIWIVIYFMIPYIKSSLSTSMMGPRYFTGMMAPILLILAFYLSRINNTGLRNGILAGVMGYSLLLLFLKESPYYTQTTSYREIAQEAKTINNDAFVWYISFQGQYFPYYLRQNDFSQIRAHFNAFTKLMGRDTPEEYFVFLDLRPTPKRYRDSIPVVQGYEEISSRTFANKHNIKTVQLIRYRKLKDSI